MFKKILVGIGIILFIMFITIRATSLTPREINNWIGNNLTSEENCPNCGDNFNWKHRPVDSIVKKFCTNTSLTLCNECMVQREFDIDAIRQYGFQHWTHEFMEEEIACLIAYDDTYRRK